MRQSHAYLACTTPHIIAITFSEIRNAPSRAVTIPSASGMPGMVTLDKHYRTQLNQRVIGLNAEYPSR